MTPIQVDEDAGAMSDDALRSRNMELGQLVSNRINEVTLSVNQLAESDAQFAAIMLYALSSLFGATLASVAIALGEKREITNSEASKIIDAVVMPERWRDRLEKLRRGVSS
jgi:hypothetical protein